MGPQLRGLALWVAGAMVLSGGDLAPKAELGRYLFFDTRLSADSSVSCASCHQPEHAFADPARVSTGAHGAVGTRNSPTILNLGNRRRFFWDGRADTLEQQAAGPLLNPVEMGNTREGLIAAISAISGYKPLFAAAFGDDQVTFDRITAALADFQRSLLFRDAPVDRGELTLAQRRGKELFEGKARCATCHSGPDFTNGDFVNLGHSNPPEPDPGRFEVTRQRSDWRVFKTPTLRNITRTAPYMHHGGFATLREVLDMYSDGGVPAENKEYRILKLSLSDAEKDDIIEFLGALEGEGWKKVSKPKVLPQ